MLSENVNNDYLLELLALQQDGKNAISAPSNWTTQRPLLEVDTDVDEIINDLKDALLQRNGENKTARWHFFIGSPGNGKSAAMGKLCRLLLDRNGCRVSDETGIAIEDLDETAVPYAINVYEGSNKYASAHIIQDASVVRNPYSPDVDPAMDLLRTLEDIWQKGTSLVVCTNRGVLEKAHRDNHTDHATNSKPWFKILSRIISANTSNFVNHLGSFDFDRKKAVFDNVAVTYSHLDNRSLLLGCDTFDQLLQKAADPRHWSVCESCSTRKMCPFKANRDWLAELESRQRFLQLLKRAEILSGQIIVFREALAVISLVLAGCPRDYEDIHPCEWVKRKAATSDVFSLATRRIYMCLFGSFCPYGLEVSDSIRKEQLYALGQLHEAIGDSSPEVQAAIRHVIHREPPSTDVGVTRLLGSSGAIASIDPTREALPKIFYDFWDSDFEAILQSNLSNFGSIEEECTTIWRKLEQGIEFASEHWAPKAHWAIRRWSSNFLLHFGALIEGYSAWGPELDDFAKLLELVNLPKDQRNLDDKRKIRVLEKELEELLDSIAGKEYAGTVQLSENAFLAGDWVNFKLKPKTDARKESGSVSLSIVFDGKEHSVLSALMYFWLTRRAEGKLDQRCFPLELLAGATDARVRAAAKCGYAFENENIEIIVKTDSKEDFVFSRLDGEVDLLNG